MLFYIRLIFIAAVTAIASYYTSTTTALLGATACGLLELLLWNLKKTHRIPVRFRMLNELMVRKHVLEKINSVTEFGFGLYNDPDSSDGYFYVVCKGKLNQIEQQSLLTFIYYYRKKFKDNLGINIDNTFKVDANSVAILNRDGDAFVEGRGGIIKVPNYLAVYKKG